MNEEFENFMHRVTEVGNVVNKLASNDLEEQQHGKILADDILKTNNETTIEETRELQTKTERTIINKYEENPDSGEMSKEVFMKTMENDAQKRAEEKKIRIERAETLKKIGNGAFKQGNYEKAITYYSKALEQRKDSSVLWNNRALCYIQLKLYEKALIDCEWALKINKSNLKALLNSAKCYKNLNQEAKFQELIGIAKEENPHFHKFIEDFANDLNISK